MAARSKVSLGYKPALGSQPAVVQDQVHVADRARAIGQRLLADAEAHSSRPTGDRWWQERLLDWCFRDEAFKTQVFRFIDVLPVLGTDEQVVSHLQAYFADGQYPLGWLAGPTLGLARATPPGKHVLAALTRGMARRMARRFIGGETAADLLPELRHLWAQRRACTLHLLGEATVSEAEAQGYQRQYLALLDTLAGPVAVWPADPLLDGGPDDRWSRLSLSLKLSSLYSQLDPLDFEGTVATLKARVRPIFRRAQVLGAFIYFDMEQSDYKNVVLRVFEDLGQEEEFRSWSGTGIALQAYLRDTEQDVRELIEWARARPSPITVRLVRGAYWDAETVTARLRQWPSPVFTRKEETDASYERLTGVLLQAYPAVRLALGTHNVHSLAVGVATAEALGLPEEAIEIQMLYGMADELKEAVVGLGRRLRVYVPFGELIPGMGYLVRRLLENTSNQSFLRLNFGEGRGRGNGARA